MALINGPTKMGLGGVGVVTALSFATRYAIETAERTGMTAIYDGTGLIYIATVVAGGAGFAAVGSGLRDVIREAQTPQAMAYEEAKHASHQAKGKPE